MKTETERRLARLSQLEAEGIVTSEHAALRRKEIPTEGWDDRANECPACAGPCEFPPELEEGMKDAREGRWSVLDPNALLDDPTVVSRSTYVTPKGVITVTTYDLDALEAEMADVHTVVVPLPEPTVDDGWDKTELSPIEDSSPWLPLPPRGKKKKKK